MQGFGKRRSKNNIRGEFDPLFVSWVPKHVDRKAFVDDVKISSYADDYNRDPTSPHIIAEVQSIATERETNPPTPAPLETSVYSSVYRHGQPDHEQSKEIRRETFERFLTTRTRLHQQKATDRSPSVAACLVWNNNETKKAPVAPNEHMINIVVPITLQPRANATPRPRAQSAGPRLMSTAFNPAGISQKPYQSQSMEMFRTTIATSERPHTATTTSRDHYTGKNFGLKVAPPPRAPTSFEQTQTNSMESLISKYM